MGIMKLKKVDVFKNVFILNLSGNKERLKILTRRCSVSPDMKKSQNCELIVDAIRRSGSELESVHLCREDGVLFGRLLFRNSEGQKNIPITSSEAIGVAHELDKPIFAHDTGRGVLMEDYIGIPLNVIINAFFD